MFNSQSYESEERLSSNNNNISSTSIYLIIKLDNYQYYNDNRYSSYYSQISINTNVQDEITVPSAKRMRVDDLKLSFNVL